MSEQTNNIQNNLEDTQLTELEEKFCDLYVNGGVGFAGRLGTILRYLAKVHQSVLVYRPTA